MEEGAWAKDKPLETRKGKGRNSPPEKGHALANAD